MAVFLCRVASGRLAQLVRARALQARGRRFEPFTAHHEPVRGVNSTSGFRGECMKHKHILPLVLLSSLALLSAQTITTGPSKVTGKPTTTADGLKYWDIKVGTGATAVARKQVTVNYTGWLVNGKKFNSSLGQKPFPLTLGAGQVIQGWDEGVARMKA